MGKYDDMIDLAPPEPARHARMPIEARAAQFAPFASLISFAGEIAATNRETSGRAVLSEESMEELDEALRDIGEKLPGCVPVRITHYASYADGKAGGRYVAETVRVAGEDPLKRELRLADGRVIRFEDLYSLEEVTEDE